MIQPGKADYIKDKDLKMIQTVRYLDKIIAYAIYYTFTNEIAFIVKRVRHAYNNVMNFTNTKIY